MKWPKNRLPSQDLLDFLDRLISKVRDCLFILESERDTDLQCFGP